MSLKISSIGRMLNNLASELRVWWHLRRAIKRMERMSEEERAEMFEAQRQSWMRSCTKHGPRNCRPRKSIK